MNTAKIYRRPCQDIIYVPKHDSDRPATAHRPAMLAFVPFDRVILGNNNEDGLRNMHAMVNRGDGTDWDVTYVTREEVGRWEVMMEIEQ